MNFFEIDNLDIFSRIDFLNFRDSFYVKTFALLFYRVNNINIINKFLSSIFLSFSLLLFFFKFSYSISSLYLIILYFFFNADFFFNVDLFLIFFLSVNLTISIIILITL